jgi:GAF domain-containing protein
LRRATNSSKATPFPAVFAINRGGIVHETVANPYNHDTIAAEKLQLFQRAVNLLAEMLNVPAALIMRVDGPQIEVFMASESAGNPYTAGDNEKYFDSGLYCETVVKSEKQLLVPNALEDPDWDDNPDIKLNMVSYLGLPLMRPDGKVFGTICVLDDKTNNYNETHIQLLEKFKSLIELTLADVLAQQEIRQRDEFIGQISRIYPICSYCKQIRLADGQWVPVESYIQEATGHTPSHSICPECYKRANPGG